ncbi:hypothetical protein [Nocardia australiensis]|uniref:hypothetical protein n=1 Tax=Nocardia australiensis TaxID=2887191 RepID=UPI001D13F714|nr:hypothetical protein [Nocardia australiensis]
MDQAWDVDRDAMVDAEELRYRPDSGSGNYECVGCGCPATPAALDSEHVRPYFRASKDHPHLGQCPIAGDPTLVRNDGPLEPAQTERAAGTGYPSRLVRTTLREQVDPTAVNSPERRSSQSRSRSGESGGGERFREATAATIRPFCRTFVRYPNNRSDLRVHIPGVDAEHYQYAFRRLVNNKIVVYPHSRIFLRHAGRVAVQVRVHANPQWLELEVSNPVPESAADRAAPAGHGSGLRGIRERAELLGGDARLGLEDGQWRTQVRLPNHGLG